MHGAYGRLGLDTNTGCWLRLIDGVRTELEAVAGSGFDAAAVIGREGNAEQG